VDVWLSSLRRLTAEASAYPYRRYTQRFFIDRSTGVLFGGLWGPPGSIIRTFSYSYQVRTSAPYARSRYVV
jgi:hypothetical protein